MWKPSQAPPERALRGEQRKSASRDISPTWAWVPLPVCVWCSPRSGPCVSSFVHPCLAWYHILAEGENLLFSPCWGWNEIPGLPADFSWVGWEGPPLFNKSLLQSHGQLALGALQPHRVFGDSINRGLKVWTLEWRLVLSLPSLSKPRLFHLWNGNVYLIPRNVCWENLMT